eukprot:TRINITY_DN32022_c0_g1_i2.p1 TRINITY_DN32022_c0_g1~~TRINITY_DN32022_c0_g1_i2.p1  ORF type:complete len:104 (+),score=17.97 TRINITY_DN32022_c0_g1_i2:312-623(+)
MNALKHVRPGGGFVPNFTLFQKCDVNGPNRIPLYEWALGICPYPPSTAFNDKGIYMYSQFNGNDIRWNYEKILFDKTGKPYRRYHSYTEIEEMMDDILMLVNM